MLSNFIANYRALRHEYSACRFSGFRALAQMLTDGSNPFRLTDLAVYDLIKRSNVDNVIAEYRARQSGFTHRDVAVCGTVAFIIVGTVYAYLAYTAIHTVAATFRVFS